MVSGVIFATVGLAIQAQPNTVKNLQEVPRDTISISGEAQVPDTTISTKDSLEKLVPYLNKVNADSPQELMVVYMLLILLATWLSEDLACIGAGLMVAQGMIEFWPAALAAILGIYVADFALYIAGRLLGIRIFSIPPFKWLINKEHIESAVLWFQKKGPIILIASRFIPGSRIPVYLSAGILKNRAWTFIFYFGLPVLLWTPFLIWISVFAGDKILSFYHAYDDYALWIIAGLVVIITLVLKYLIPSVKDKIEI
jgi:membrane protein DedA with SNARE-associated domain